ncbi:MAG: AAA family ATPase, partial [Phycisphaerales bacterium]|nr:AAA family ATPase [Phycisphaerales bacterium]
KETAALRRLIAEATEILSRAFSTRPDGDAVQSLIDESENAIFKVAERAHTGGVAPIAEALQETFRRIDSRSHRGSLTGIPSGYYDLDEMLCGFNAGDLVILAARPSMGKTALALNVFEHAALNPPPWMEAEQPVVLAFSLEMGRQQIVSRMLCSRARVDAHKLKTGNIPSEDYSELSRAAGELSSARMFIDDTPGLSVMAMRSRARRLKQQQKGLHLVIVDYLQLMTQPKAESRQMEISQISRSLKELARE